MQIMKEHGPAPEYEITKELSDLTLMFIVASIIYFLIAGSMAIIMRVIYIARAIYIGKYILIWEEAHCVLFSFTSL